MGLMRMVSPDKMQCLATGKALLSRFTEHVEGQLALQDACLKRLNMSKLEESWEFTF